MTAANFLSCTLLKGGENQNCSAVSKTGAYSKKTEEDKDLFKMAKFKNVPSKVNSHQKPEMIPFHK